MIRQKKTALKIILFCIEKKSTRNFVVGNENFPQSVKSYAFLQGIIVFSYSFFCDFILIIFVMTMTKRNSRPLGKFAKKIGNFFDLTTSTQYSRFSLDLTLANEK